jgi:hypothetical protein
MRVSANLLREIFFAHFSCQHHVSKFGRAGLWGCAPIQSLPIRFRSFGGASGRAIVVLTNFASVNFLTRAI